MIIRGERYRRETYEIRGENRGEETEARDIGGEKCKRWRERDREKQTQGNRQKRSDRGERRGEKHRRERHRERTEGTRHRE